MTDPNRKSSGSESRALAKDPKKELRLQKGLTLPHARVKPKRGDKDVLADMGLLALLPDAMPEADRSRRREPVRHKGVTAEQRAAARDRLLAALERNRKPAHQRSRAHLLRLMEPGAAYVVNDLIRACPQLSGDAVKAHLRCRMLQQGLVERVPAPPGMKHRAPLMHGSKHKDPIRWLYRLTESGIAERAAVQDGDAGES